MIFTLDVCRASKGDCFFLHFGSEDDPGLILIDGGPKTVFRSHLRPRIEQIRKARRLDDQASLMVDLLMVSHVDDDHIQGILDLTREEIIAADAARPKLLNVQSFWHNSFDDVLGRPPDELTASVSRHFGSASLAGEGDLPDDELLEVERLYQEQHPDEDGIESCTSSLKVLASLEQGFRLRLAAERLGYPRNPEFDGKLIVARKGDRPVPISRELKITIVGPMGPEIADLQKRHDEWLRELKAKGKSPPEALAAYVDRSVPNLASIVVLAELGGKRMLLTGDARGDRILEGLEMLGLLQPDAPMHVDLLKVPHHGSANNLDKDFFARILADHYVFSGNGEHGNPEREAFDMLFAARGEEDITVYLTYPLDEIDAQRRKVWDKERLKQLKKRKKETDDAKRRNIVVGPEWSSALHGLADFFRERKIAGWKCEIVPEDSLLIDLLQPMGR